MTDSAIGTSSLSSSSSAMSLSSISEQKYTQLRKRLDQLGYRQTLGVESLPLIEKLFNDLVHTTESLKKTKLELNNVSRTTKSSKADLSSTSILNTSANLEAAAYRADNAKLIKENNQLHLDFIKLKDDFDQQIKDLKSKLSKVENENCDLRFLNTQYLTKMRTIERESNSKGRKIIELQERSLHASNAIIQIPNTSDISFSFRRQRLDADSLLPPPVTTNLNSSATISAANHRPNVEVKDPYIIDVVKIADERIQELEALLNQSKQSGEIWEKKCSNLKYQVELRDKEIERLNNLMENGRPRDISQLAIESELESHEKVVKNLNIQIEYLQEKNYQLEKRLEELLEEKQNNASKNRNEPDKNEPIIRQLELEKNDLSNRINVLKSELDDRCTDINNLHALIAKIQEDKTKLSKKISNLLENEKELVREIDSLRYLKRTPSGGRAANKTPPSKLDSYVKNLESERDFYKREIETLQELLKSSTASSNGNSGAYNHHNSRAASKSPATRLSSNGRQQKSMSPPSKLRCSVCANRSQSPSPIAQQQQQQAIEEIKKLKREKDELKGLLDKFEGYMDQIQTNVTHLTSERDQIMDMYNKTKEELNKCKSAISQQSAVNESTKNQAQHHSLAVQTMLHRVESERDTALFDLRNVMKERDSLADRLRHVSETSSKDKLTLETELDNVRERLTTAEMEKSELSHQVKLLKDELDEIESKMKSQSYQLVQAVQDLNDQKSASAQIRLLAEESRNALEEHRMQLKLKNDEIQRLDQHKFHLEQKLLNIQEHNRALQDELGSLRHTISTLDKEKDKLLSTLDEKTVECVTLKQELASKHHRLDELNSQLSQLESSFDTATSHLNSQKKDLNSLRIQLDRVNEENALLARKLDSAVRENKRLQDDMMTVTRESQVLHCELDKLRVEKESFSDKISGYTSELNRYDDAIKQKDADRQQLLEQLRQMAQDFNGLKLQLGACESELSSCRMDAQGKAVEIKRLRERLDKSERDYQQHLSANQEYEVKLSNCNMSLQKYEEALKQLEAEKKNIVEDLMHFREINMNLEQAKEELARQLTSRELDNEQLSNQMYDRSAEIDLLKSQISSERAMIKNLEELIASNREKDFHLQMNNQEKEGEIKLLKERILIGEQKIQSQNKDLNMLRSKVVEMETETEKLRRQLTNERFERERAAQELRKKIESSCSSSPPTSSLMSSHHMHQHQHIRSSLSPPKKASILNYSSTSSTTSTTCACPPPNGSQNTSSSANGGGVLILPHPPALTNNSNTSATSSSSSAAAAAVAAAAAAVAASNVAAAASGYRSLSPIRTSTIITKEHSSMRYSS